jgi:hypothetical protein
MYLDVTVKRNAVKCFPGAVLSFKIHHHHFPYNCKNTHKEECRLLGCGAVWVFLEPNESPPSSKNRRARNSVSSNQYLLKTEATNSSEKSVLTGAIRRNIPEDAIFIVTAVKTSNLT